MGFAQDKTQGKSRAGSSVARRVEAKISNFSQKSSIKVGKSAGKPARNHSKTVIFEAETGETGILVLHGKTLCFLRNFNVMKRLRLIFLGQHVDKY